MRAEFVWLLMAGAGALGFLLGRVVYRVSPGDARFVAAASRFLDDDKKGPLR